LHIIKLAEGTNVMIELKSGEVFNGILSGVDKFMNVKIEKAYINDKVILE
jgi:small nuclear ribonucleoprotein (snRNP)-like protein